MLVKPKNRYDIAVVLALIRPCASMNGQKSDFLRDYSGFLRDQRTFTRENDVDYLIFDDDAIKYISRLLDISEGEADVYRKAFAKNRWDKKNEFNAILKYKHPDFDEEKISRNELQLFSLCIGLSEGT
jgi:DNA polymerase III alpha subunit